MACVYWRAPPLAPPENRVSVDAAWSAWGVAPTHGHSPLPLFKLRAVRAHQNSQASGRLSSSDQSESFTGVSFPTNRLTICSVTPAPSEMVPFPVRKLMSQVPALSSRVPFEREAGDQKFAAATDDREGRLQSLLHPPQPHLTISDPFPLLSSVLCSPLDVFLEKRRLSRKIELFVADRQVDVKVDSSPYRPGPPARPGPCCRHGQYRA